MTTPHLASKERLKNLLSHINSVPTLPEVHTRVNTMLTNPDTRAQDVSKVISEDPALTFSLLKVVNSAFYGLSRKITQIDHAISILGFSATHSLLMTTSVLTTFKGTKNKVAGFNSSKFWTHCLGVATASRMLSLQFGMRAQAEDLYVAGLLHDVGKIIIQQNGADGFKEVLEKVQKKGWRTQEAEVEILGFTHQEAGGFLAQKWNLPSTLTAIIAGHHNPFDDPKQKEFAKLASVVHLADVLCKMIDVGETGDPRIPEISTEAWKELDCDHGIVDKILYQLREQKPHIVALSAEVLH